MRSPVCQERNFVVKASLLTSPRRAIALDLSMVTALLDTSPQLLIGDGIRVSARIIRSLLDQVRKVYLVWQLVRIIRSPTSHRKAFALTALVDAVQTGRITLPVGLL